MQFQSRPPGSEFDARFATQLMAVEANLLGYGAKIISSPTITLNGEKKDKSETVTFVK